MMSPHKIAGLLSFLGAAPILVSWYILLFIALPENVSLIQSVIDQLQYMLSSENPNQVWFILFLLLPICGIAIGVSYLTNFAKSKNRATILLFLTCILGVITLALGKFSMAVFVFLPAIWGWRCVLRSNPSFKRDDQGRPLI